MANEEVLSAAGPSIDFPLGLALLLMLLFCMSGFLTCWLHWEKIRSFILPSTEDDDHADNIQTNIHNQYLPRKSSPIHLTSRQNQEESMLVSMPGDQFPKFVAMACPCKPPAAEKVTVPENIHIVDKFSE